MPKKILMITGSHDRTCDYIERKYPETQFFRLNLDEFSTYFISVTANGFCIETKTGTITSESCSAIYYRKPIAENLNGVFQEKYHRFAHSESFSLIDGIMESFKGTCLSRPSILRKANNKILQLSLASEIGFSLPKSIITNSHDRIKKIQEEELIVKPLSVGTVDHEGTREYVQTNLVDSSIDASLLKFCPSYFQQYIEKDYELRVTVIGNDFHTVRIDSKNKIDWRKANNEVSYSLTDLPDVVSQQCITFMNSMSINFGCFDFMVKDEELYFLEMNANGQWAWLDEITQFGISKSLIKYLTNGHSK